jgi:CCR4-NOT transcription complex subunit 1
LHLFQQILKHPDVFCFAEHPCNMVNMEVLKSPPDPENKEVATW